jgi:hypothetical protein
VRARRRPSACRARATAARAGAEYHSAGTGITREAHALAGAASGCSSSRWSGHPSRSAAACSRERLPR